MAKRKRQRETVTIQEVADRLGISRALAYKAAKSDELPVKVLRVGRRMVVSAAALNRALEAQQNAGG